TLLVSGAFLFVARPDSLPETRVASHALGNALRGIPANAAWAAYRVSWWAHVLLVLIFLNYLPYSKHLHVATSLFTVFFSNTSWKSEGAAMRPMDLEADVEKFGASD